MKKSMPIVVTAVAVVVVAAVLMSRPRSDSEPANAEEQLAQSSTTAMPNSRPPEEKTFLKAVQATAEPLNDMQSLMRMKADAIQQDSEYKEHPGMLFDLMHEASLQEVQELLTLSEDDLNYSVGFRDDMKAAAFERWYHLDPTAALRAMDASTLSSSMKNTRMETFLEDWASRSPQEVMDFVEQGELTGVSSDLMVGALVRGSAKSGDLEVVDAGLARIEDPKLRYYALKSAARVLQRDHADQFEDWLNALPAEEQNTAIAESAWMLADKDIDQALAGLDQLEERGADELPVTRLRVAVKWAENDPVRAANWVVAQNVTGEDREILFANIMRVWVSKDQNAAINWADSLIEKGEIDEAFMNRVGGRL